jgi:hypothetical protein
MIIGRRGPVTGPYPYGATPSPEKTRARRRPTCVALAVELFFAR